MTNSIRIETKDEEKNKVLTYLEPSPKVLTIDMDAYYEWVRSNPEEHFNDRSSVEWPSNMLARSEFTEGFHEEFIEVADIEAVRRFRQILAKHGSVLTSAREKLREFIKGNFNVDEILYVSKELSRTWP